jgi:hypothetical protein
MHGAGNTHDIAEHNEICVGIRKLMAGRDVLVDPESVAKLSRIKPHCSASCFCPHNGINEPGPITSKYCLGCFIDVAAELRSDLQDEWRGYPAQLSAAIRPYVLIGPSAETIGKQLPWVIPVLEKVDGIPVVMNKRLNQNDNRNGIIIGVGRGRLNKAQLIRRSAWRRV